MATSGSTDFSIDRDGLINGALRIIGVLDPEAGSATATQITNGAETLNMIIKTMAADGMPLWAIKKKTITLVADQANYTVTGLSIPRPLKIVAAYRSDITGTDEVDTPMEIITRDEYIQLGNKATNGPPILLYYDPQLTDALATVYVYPTPDSTVVTNYNIKMYYQSPFEDFDASTDTPDFPQEWYNTLKWKLAAELGFEYGVPGSRLDRIIQKAEAEHEYVLDMYAEEGSIYFHPNTRMMR
jgi:hypothetical protein